MYKLKLRWACGPFGRYTEDIGFSFASPPVVRLVMLQNYFYQIDTKRKPPCIGGMDLVSLSCNRVFISAESVGRD